MPVSSSADAAKAASDKKAAETAAAAKAAASASAKDIADLAKRFGQGGDLSIEQDNYGNFRLVSNQNGQTVPMYFVVAANGKDWDVFTGSQIVKKYKADVAKGIGLEGLRKKLYEIGFISKAEYTTKDEAAFNNAILGAANAHSMEQVQKYTLNPGQKSYTFTPFTGWLGTKQSGITPTTPNIDTEFQATTKIQTDQDIDSFTNDLIGRDATVEEKANYFKLVSDEMAKTSRKSTVKGTAQTTTGAFLNEDDYFRIASKVIAPSLQNTPLEGIDKLGGKVIKQITDLKDYAHSYGIPLDSKQALNYVMQGLDVGGSLNTGAIDSQKNILREMSKAFYSNISSLIDAGVKPLDIANQFAYYKGKILEQPDNAVNVFDKDIQAALKNNGKSGVMSLTDYELLLRNSPDTKGIFLGTKGAREEASNYANTILKSFGLIG